MEYHLARRPAVKLGALLVAFTVLPLCGRWEAPVAMAATKAACRSIWTCTHVLRPQCGLASGREWAFRTLPRLRAQGATSDTSSGTVFCASFVGALTGGVQASSGSPAGRGGRAGRIMALDPGRSELCWEYLNDGRILMDLPLDHGGSLQVTAHSASENEAPAGSLPGSLQEWRALRFTPAEGTTNLIQSATKVCVAPSGPEPRVRMRGEVLPLAYTKSIAAVVLSTLLVLGAPVLPAAAKVAQRKLRILCIGLGGGSLPSFFTSALPHCEVDVAELEQAVLRAAVDGMGFIRGPRLRAEVKDGVEAALEAAAAAGQEGAYDAVVVDAYDAAGGVPRELWSQDGGLARAMVGGLLRRQGGLVATNFLPHVDLAPPLAAYRTALAAHGAGPGFSVQANRPDGQEGNTGNRIAVQTSGGPAHHGSLPQLRGRLSRAAAEVGSATRCPFDMADLAARGLRLWPHA